jgi:hypothetical protein
MRPWARLNDIKEIEDEYEHPNRSPPLVEELAESRTSKMFKRMSNMSGRPWKNSNNSLAVQPELNPINRSPIYPRV